MSLQVAAKHYLKYFDDRWVPADNAPIETKQLITKSNTHVRLVVRALRQLAGEEIPNEPKSLPDLLEFFADVRSAQPCLDRTLRSKVQSKTIEELFQRAYNDHCIDVMGYVRKWLLSRIE
jgi:hypothetical protein